jgi:hypothetical protein
MWKSHLECPRRLNDAKTYSQSRLSGVSVSSEADLCYNDSRIKFNHRLRHAVKVTFPSLVRVTVL